MRKKLKAILSAAIMTTLIARMTPLPASSNIIIKEAIEEERYEKEKENLPYMIELIVSMLFLPPAVYHNSGEYPDL